MEIPFDSGFAFKIIRLFLIVDLALLPILLLLRLNLFGSYFFITLSESFLCLVLGVIQIFCSFSSTVEREDHKYVGDGFLKYELKPIEVTEAQRRAMRAKGATMVILGLLLPAFIILISAIHG